MLLTVASAFMYVEKRQLVEVFPESVRKVWNDWELRVMMLLSLTLQIILILLGDKRKYVGRTRLRIALWSAYLLADLVATVALGIISRTYTDPSQQDCERTPTGAAELENATKELVSFWAPFLLLHLGGPDTITAYSLEDNELWLRHLLGLVVQTGVAVYIFLMAWPGSSWLPVLSLLVLNAGLIKYGERTWSLRSANSEHLRDSMLTPPDSGPNYAKFMEEFTLKKAEGFHVEAAEVIETPVPTDHPVSTNAGALGHREFMIVKAYHLFQTFKRLFVDLILSFHHRDSSRSYFEDLPPEDAFHVVEIELGFAFDILYTKAPVVYTFAGCMLRLVSFSSILWVLMGFFVLSDKHSYHKIDLAITYLLTVVALLLEMYAAFVMLFSDWTYYYWLSRESKFRSIFRTTSCLRRSKKRWWSNSMAQYNLLSVCLQNKPPVFHGVQKLLRINEIREKHRYKTYEKVSSHLKQLIFTDLKNCTSLNWATTIEFDQTILIWHIATDLCYYSDGGGDPSASVSMNANKKSSKQISDYMLYLLVMCPSLLPMGIGMMRFRDTCAEAKEFFAERNVPRHDFTSACEKLLEVNTEVWPIKVKGDRSKSVLFDACRLAKTLGELKEEKKWEFVSQMWVEILAYAATHCNSNHHAQQLRKGGELLTHVWLLMAHLGITQQFQISKGHARAKLIVK